MLEKEKLKRLTPEEDSNIVDNGGYIYRPAVPNLSDAEQDTLSDTGDIFYCHEIKNYIVNYKGQYKLIPTTFFANRKPKELEKAVKEFIAVWDIQWKHVKYEADKPRCSIRVKLALKKLREVVNLIDGGDKDGNI